MKANEALETIKNCENPASEGRDIFDNCLKSEEKFILQQKISGNINCENCLYSSACALGDIQACIIDKPVSEDLEEASKKWLIPKLDKTYAIYGEAKMMELTRFDGYAMLDAIEFGAKWQKEQMMAKAVDATCFGFQGAALFSFRLPAGSYLVGSEVKVIVIKDE